MTPPRNGTTSTRRRKASIEIYFVLYLSAIVLLLGTTRTTAPPAGPDADAIIRDLMVDFQVGVERVALVYTVLPAGLQSDSSARGLKRDSVNVVRARGSVEDVRFDIAAIRDTSTGDLLPIRTATIERVGAMAASVRCSPATVAADKVYEITVAASALPAVPGSVPERKRRDLEQILQRGGRVYDTVTFTISVFAVSHRGMIPSILAAQSRIADTPSSALMTSTPSLLPSTGFSGAGLGLEPASTEMRRAAGAEWRNAISISGVSNAVSELDFSFSPPGVSFASIGPNRIEVRGRTPRSGDQPVTVTATRKSDKRVVAVARFKVATAQFPDPAIPEIMYSDQVYRIDLSSRDIPQAEIESEIIENGRSFRGPAVVNYRAGAPGRVQIYRIHDGQRVEPSYSAQIMPLPRPVIRRPISQGDAAIITTVCFGSVNGRQNSVSLRVLDGNASDDPEQIDSRYDPSTGETTQRWRVVRRSSDREFTFTVWAIDLRGGPNGSRSTFALP